MCSLFSSLKKAQEVEILVDCKLHSGITRGIYSKYTSGIYTTGIYSRPLTAKLKLALIVKVAS